MVRQDDCTRPGFIIQCDVLMEGGGGKPETSYDVLSRENRYTSGH